MRKGLGIELGFILVYHCEVSLTLLVPPVFFTAPGKELMCECELPLLVLKLALLHLIHLFSYSNHTAPLVI